jgi:hypothetical protein
MPPGRANSAQTTVVVPAWITASSIAYRACDQAPRPTMCSAQTAAPASVRSSPAPSEAPRRASTPRPLVASTIAIQTFGVTRSRSSTAPNRGVNTTYMPVTKPLTDAEVWVRPTVSSRLATPNSTPRTTALRRSAEGIAATPRGRSAARTAVARANRRVR